MHSIIFFILGLILLYLGGELLVKGSLSIAKRLNISTLVVGLTIVSFATSAPELFVCVKAAINGNSNIAFGNIIGSNIANLALVLGVTALIFRVKISRQTLYYNFPFMFFVSVLLAIVLFFFNGISNYFGYFFILLLSAFIVFLIKNSRDIINENTEDLKIHESSILMSMLFIIFGVFLLKYGADWLVDGTIFIAKLFDVSDRVIAVTVVAVGTSIPELVTSIIAALKKEENLAVGNLIGSNIFNVLAVLGITSTISELSIEDIKILTFDIPWMLAITLVLAIIIYISSSSKVTRKEGVVLLSLYISYIYMSLI